MMEVGFEPTRANTAELKSAPLDHSGTPSWSQRGSNPRPWRALIGCEPVSYKSEVEPRIYKHHALTN